MYTIYNLLLNACNIDIYLIVPSQYVHAIVPVDISTRSLH